MELYTSGTNQNVRVHDRGDCEGKHCAIHNPSQHPLVYAPTHFRFDRGIMERICKHGIGHPDPDQYEYLVSVLGKDKADAHMIHGCDGCCVEKERV